MSNKKYVTSLDYNGMDYRSIAEVMTKSGHKMNHSSVRNYITRGFCKVVKGMSKDYGINYTDDQIKKIAQSPEFQSSIIDLMKETEQ
jgi:hypothetical protein|tara:strand:- start:65 stop:325 length:261 start_codon:yes stop_codon:yes gene_type:complete